MDVFDAAQLYARENRPLIAIVGKDYGSGSSRDWAAKGPFLLVNKISCNLYITQYIYMCFYLIIKFTVIIIRVSKLL